MVLEEVGGVPILASWWPLSATAMVHRRDIDGRGVVFGNQGDLYMNAMTWWDHDTSSVWSQPTGEAILGPLKGERWDPERGLKAEDPSNPEILVQLLAASFPSDYMNLYPSGESGSRTFRLHYVAP